MPAAPASTVGVASRAASGSSVIAQAAAELLPATDTLWQDVYHVIAPISGGTGDVQLWKAHRTDTAEEVVLRVVPGIKNAGRLEAWKRLCTIELSHLQRAREEAVIGGCTVEVVDAVRGVSLAAWRSGRSSVDAATVEALVRQLAEALGVLHATGLVHLGLKPETVFVREEGGVLNFTLAGLETVVCFEGDTPIPAAVDPLYAPPEAAGLLQHEPGPALCAWDWWSLGRVAQELILGRHVVDKLPDADATQSTLMRAARAETLLFEHAAKGMKAGAVEVMVGLEPRLDLLLRGLLSSSPEERWGGEFVDRWLRQKPVKEHYTVPRTEKKFRWRGRLYTVIEAAKDLRTAELWPEAASHIFEPDSPNTLAHFIRRAPDHDLVRSQLADLLKLMEVEPLRSTPPAAAREVVLTLALLQLAGANLLWRGRRLDGTTLHAILAEDADNPERLAFARALTNRTITAQIDRCDFESGRSLTELGRIAAEAESMIRRQGWLKGADDRAVERIFRLSIAPEADLHAARERLRHDFARSNQPAVDKLFKSAKCTRAELVALAWAEPSAAACGFVKHADWEATQLKQLRERGEQLAGALFWARLGRALAAGPAIFGGIFVLGAIWCVAAIAVAGVWPGPKWLPVAVAPLVLALIMRVAGVLMFSGAVRRWVPGAPPWKFFDGIARCRAELRSTGKGLDATALEAALAEINTGIAQLKLINPPPVPVDGPPRFGSVRTIALAGWFVLAAVVAACGWRAKTHRPSLESIRTAWFPSAVVPLTPGAIAGAALPAGAVPPAAEAKLVDKESAGPSGPIKVSWPYKPGDDAQVIGLKENLPATNAQNSYALKRGREIVAPYRLETINTLVIFEVPVGDKVAVMVFDGVKGGLVNSRVYVLEFRPLARSWIEVGEHKGIYLGE